MSAGGTPQQGIKGVDYYGLLERNGRGLSLCLLFFPLPEVLGGICLPRRSSCFPGIIRRGLILKALHSDVVRRFVTIDMKTLILGIGNPILTDDGVGIRVAQQIGQQEIEDVAVAETCEAGLALLDYIADHDRMIIIDSIKTGQGKPGELYHFRLDELGESSGFATSHGLDMATAFKLGERAGYKIPGIISIYAVEVSDNDVFGETCSEEIEGRIPEIASEIIQAEKLQ
jgi:hydrogenase maturation protease